MSWIQLDWSTELFNSNPANTVHARMCAYDLNKMMVNGHGNMYTSL